MNHFKSSAFLLALMALVVLGTTLQASAQEEVVGAALTGVNEVPAISTLGNGLLRAIISSDETSILAINLSKIQYKPKKNLPNCKLS
jgi:hypothetical protein